MPSKAANHEHTITTSTTSVTTTSSTSTPPPSTAAPSPPSAPAAPLRVNLGDPSVIKHVLDEHAALTLCSAGYAEDVMFSNVKLLLGTLAVLIAAACNLLAGPFPSSFPSIQYSVIAYFGLHAAIQLLHFTLPRHCVLITKPRKAITESAATPAQLDPVKRKALLRSSKPNALTRTSPPLVLTSNLPRYSTSYTLGLGQKGAGSGGVEGAREMEVTAFFDSTGVFLKEKFEAEVLQLIAEVERKEVALGSRADGSKVKAQ